jgi:SpoVK/Ycf46/Vps4 family AAA+-type ATPase
LVNVRVCDIDEFTETIAETSHKPLYFIGTGELGTEVSYTEPTLTRIFDLAKDWNAILLLDEADLFLSKRTQDDVKRNAFVTIFLRLLEYYQGILFLTTNRVEEFDPAFKSRIHLSVEYQPLNPVKRACIWRNLLGQIRDCRDWDQATYDRLGQDFEINGREIKNLIKPALAIATYRKEPLTENVLRLVYSINYENVATKK